jgi:hypothetical protein
MHLLLLLLFRVLLRLMLSVLLLLLEERVRLQRVTRGSHGSSSRSRSRHRRKQLCHPHSVNGSRHLLQQRAPAGRPLPCTRARRSAAAAAWRCCCSSKGVGPGLASSCTLAATINQALQCEIEPFICRQILHRCRNSRRYITDPDFIRSRI